MAYLVKIAARAEHDLALLYETTNASDSGTARKWYQGLKRAILTLEAQPNRCPATPENGKLRHLLYGRKPHIYRVIYRIVEKQKRVHILHIRHGARKRILRVKLSLP